MKDFDKNQIHYQATRLLERSMIECSPDKLIQKSLSFSEGKILINNTVINLIGDIYVIGFGKASLSMYEGLINSISNHRIKGALIVTHIQDHKTQYNNTKVIKSTHPYISDKSINAGKEILKFVSKLNKNDLLISLVSGGGSAMIAAPIDNITINEKVECISNILTAGIPEREANEIKKALSKIKGGGLAAASGSERIVNLILSDERNHKIDAIASGPTVEPEKNEAVEIIEKYAISHIIPDKILDSILVRDNQAQNNSPKKIENILAGSREDLIENMRNNASHFEFDSVHILDNLSEITSESAVDLLLAKYHEIYKRSKSGNHLVISTGEVQVPIEKINAAKGGRNQHLCALMMNKAEFDFKFSFIAYATDGVDFLEGCAGAFFTNNHLAKIKEIKEDMMQYIKNKKTYDLHKRLNTLISSNITGHNVSDFYLFSFNKER